MGHCSPLSLVQAVKGLISGTTSNLFIYLHPTFHPNGIPKKAYVILASILSCGCATGPRRSPVSLHGRSGGFEPGLISVNRVSDYREQASFFYLRMLDSWRRSHFFFKKISK